MTTLKFLSIGVGMILIGMVVGGCSGTTADQPKTSALTAPRVVHVEVRELRPRPFVETLHLSGSIKALEDVMIAPEEGGVVKEWRVEKGAYVRKGEVIVTLNDNVIKPSYEAALAQYKSAELTLEKQQKVFTEQAVSEWQLKTSEFNRDAAKAQADLMRARWERTCIRSPIDGILDDRSVDPGEMAAPGLPIARIVNIRTVKVLVNLPECYAGRIKLGSHLQLTVLAYPSEVFDGRVSFIGTAISPDNRTFPIEALVSNSAGKLKPEMIARVKIALAVQPRALLVEESIVQQVDRNKFVVYVENGGVAQERIVQLGGREGNLVEIVSGLQEGDRVIIRGFKEVADKQPVTVVSTREAGYSTPDG